MSRTELTTVMMPMYRSPPKIFRVELQATCTRKLVPVIIKLEVPRRQMSPVMSRRMRMVLRCSGMEMRRPNRKLQTHMADMP